MQYAYQAPSKAVSGTQFIVKLGSHCCCCPSCGPRGQPWQRETEQVRAQH